MINIINSTSRHHKGNNMCGLVSCSLAQSPKVCERHNSHGVLGPLKVFSSVCMCMCVCVHVCVCGKKTAAHNNVFLIVVQMISKQLM